MAKAPSKPTTKSVAKGKPPLKAAPKKAATKQAVSKTATKKTAAKPVSRTTRKKPSAKKSVAVKSSKAAVKQTLQAQLDNVTQRLNTANTKTRKNITTLEADFSALAKQMGRTKAGQTRLTRRVTELSNTLAKNIESMQGDIRKDLAVALQNPTLETLQQALARADERLTSSESAQDTAIARINRHIADIATIVENRLSQEAQAREAAMAEMKQVMEARYSALEKTQEVQSQSEQLRFSNLQSESAEAIRSLGDKLVDVAEEMGRRRETLGAKLREELNEASVSTTVEFEQFRRVVERRLEALESETGGFDTHISRAIAPLASRIEGLEYGLTQSVETPQQDFAPSLQALPPVESIAASALSAPVNQPDAAQPKTAAPYQAQDDAFNPIPAQPAPLQPAASQSFQETQPPLELSEPIAATAVPYDPAAYQNIDYGQAAAAPTAPLAQAPELQDPYASAANTQNPYSNEHAAPQGYGFAPQYNDLQHPAPPNITAEQPPFPQGGELPVQDSDLPYADPAYAEGSFGNPVQTAGFEEGSMGAARPGAFDNLKKIGRKARGFNTANADGSTGQPLLTPRNLKIGALVAALGVASFIGVQTLKGGSGPINGSTAGPEFSVASNGALDDNRPTLGGANNPLPIGNAIAPSIDQNTIGQYADNRKMTISANGETALNTAAQSGNPIAQLQLGLSQIENGELDSGVNLIRASANQEQPAALYRLAKLYETGQGVGQDFKTARQLTERAARGGNRIAMHDLALYYAEEDGRGGVEMDMPKAARWFEKAAERGVVDSQYNLGILFESGQGLPQDMESALVWYSIAGAQGDQMAASRVAVLRKMLSEEQVARADQRIAGFTPSRIDEEANGIFNNVPWAKPAQVASNGAAKASIVQTQTLLNNLGYAVGAADGAIGPKTKNAILNFQRNNGMSETGTVNAELIERLETAAGA